MAALRAARRIRPADPFAELRQLLDSLPPQARRQRTTTSAGRPWFEI